ncbi:MAG: tRNA lysidine(34) synthetase TilS [Candidatus Omnitrophica bacterium]|nr:tRNA lysidine(34) synthetase TilS [Candidatus Omnitrophota bacterium]
MAKKNKIEHFVTKRLGLAVNRYGMISAGDKVLVAVSGGKDSLALLHLLERRKRALPIDYTVMAVHITTDYDSRPKIKKKELTKYFNSLGCEYVFKEIKIAKKNKQKEQNCFWCSWNRRKVLFETAEEAGFSKIAFGHHKDDAVETFLMNMFWKAELSGMNPVQSLFEGKIAIIRPLILLEEKDVASYARFAELPELKSDCPRNSDSKRAFIRRMIKQLEKENPGVKNNICKAPYRIKSDYLTEIHDVKK